VRVLVVEDDPDQRALLALIVRQHGHEAVACASLSEAAAAPPCDLALVDRRLPDGDGLAFARAWPGRAVVLTGEEGDDARAGTEVLLKPVRPAALARLLEGPDPTRA